MLLAEANQWPEDTKDYFGEGDECHMAFHFPLMPRMYMALAREDRFPITDIMRQTPPIPDNCQWAIFLRNHDELTLEMVTDSERDYLWETYAADRRARINLGIRRRLAPLLERDRRMPRLMRADRKSTRLNSSHLVISYAVFCLKKKKNIRKKCSLVLKKTCLSRINCYHR